MDQNPPRSSVHGIFRQEYWSGLPCPPPGDLPNPGIKPTSPMSPALAGSFFTTSATWEDWPYESCFPYFPWFLFVNYLSILLARLYRETLVHFSFPAFARSLKHAWWEHTCSLPGGVGGPRGRWRHRGVCAPKSFQMGEINQSSIVTCHRLWGLRERSSIELH